MEKAVGGASSLGEGCALGAEASAIGGVVGIAPHAGNRTVFGLDEHTATDAAVTTGGFDLPIHDFPFGQALSNSRAMSGYH
jgi:hypothetical protein